MVSELSVHLGIIDENARSLWGLNFPASGVPSLALCGEFRALKGELTTNHRPNSMVWLRTGRYWGQWGFLWESPAHWVMCNLE